MGSSRKDMRVYLISFRDTMLGILLTSKDCVTAKCHARASPDSPSGPPKGSQCTVSRKKHGI